MSQTPILSLAPTTPNASVPAIQASAIGDIAAAVRTILSVSDGRLNYGRAKLALDGLVDPALDAEATMAELDRMAKRARRLTGFRTGASAKLAALRKLVYESGPWNDYRPFEYDHANLRGSNVRVKLISHYLATRRGDCVSMPLLFLILAEKLRLDMALANAPQHIFLRYREPDGRVLNLEATGTALPARDAWVRQIMPISDRAIESGFCMRTLSRREGVALMATTVLQHLMDTRRYEEAIAVSDVILEYNPTDAFTLANRGNACFKILRAEFLDTYRSAFLIPPHLRPRYAHFLARNQAAFAAAHALGWEHPL